MSPPNPDIDPVWAWVVNARVEDGDRHAIASPD